MAIDVDPDWWKHLFDEVYLLTDARSVGDLEITRREVEALCELLPLNPTDRILDLCGGQGRHSLELSGRGFGGCTVLDYSEVLLEHGRAVAADLGCEVEFLRGEAGDTGLPDVSFDHVLILGNSLGYLADEGSDRRILDEAFRVLRPGGWLLLDVADGALVREKFNPNAWHEIEGDIVVCRQREMDDEYVRAREMVLSKEQGLVRDHSYAVRLFDPPSLEALVKDAGFGEISIRRGFSPRRGNEDYGFMNHRVLVTARKEAR